MKERTLGRYFLVKERPLGRHFLAKERTLGRSKRGLKISWTKLTNILMFIKIFRIRKKYAARQELLSRPEHKYWKIFLFVQAGRTGTEAPL